MPAPLRTIPYLSREAIAALLSDDHFNAEARVVVRLSVYQSMLEGTRERHNQFSMNWVYTIWTLIKDDDQMQALNALTAAQYRRMIDRVESTFMFFVRNGVFVLTSVNGSHRQYQMAA